MSQRPTASRTTNGSTAADVTSAPVKAAAAPSASLEARLAALLQRQQAREARAFGKVAPPSASTSAAPTAAAATPRPSAAGKRNGAAAPTVSRTSPPPPIPLAPASPSCSPTTAPAPAPLTRIKVAPLSLSVHEAHGRAVKAAAAAAASQDAAHPRIGNGAAYTVSNASVPPRATGAVGGVTAERPPLPTWTSPLRRFPSTASSTSTAAYSESPLPNRSFAAFSVRDSPPSHPLGPAPMLSRAGTPTEGTAAASRDGRGAGAAAPPQRTPSPESGASSVHNEWRDEALRASTSLPDRPSPPPPRSMRNGHHTQLLQSYQSSSFSASATVSAYVSPAEEYAETRTSPPPPSPPLGANRQSASVSLTAPPPQQARHVAAPPTDAATFISSSSRLSTSPAADDTLATDLSSEASSTRALPTPSQQVAGVAVVVEEGHSWAVPAQSRYSAGAPLPPSPPLPASSLGPSANGARASAPHRSPPGAEALATTSPAERRSSSHPFGEEAPWRPDWRDTIVAGVRVCRDSPHVRRARCCTSRERPRAERGGAPVWTASSPGAWDRRTRSASTDREASVSPALPAAPTSAPAPSAFRQRAPEHHPTASSVRPLLSAALRPVLLATAHGSKFKLLDDAAPPTAAAQTAATAAAAAAGPDLVAEELHMRRVLSRLKAESAHRRLEQQRRRRLNGGVL